MERKKILVTGATGQQGGSVVNALLHKDHEIYALTRNNHSPKAKALESKGIKVLIGDLSNTDSLKSAFSQVESLFLLGTPFETDVKKETEMGINAVNVAKESGIEHLVFSSVSDADKGTKIPHFDSKYEVEKYLTASGLSYTIVAPAYFYDNVMAPFILPELQKGTFAQALAGDIPLQSISVKNIGEFVALALDKRERFTGKRFDIAGDSLTGKEYAQILSEASGKSIGYSEVPIEHLRSFSEDMALMYEWFAEVGYSVNIEKLHHNFPEVQWENFRNWALRQDWSVLD